MFDIACCGEKAGFGDLVDWEGNQSPKFKIKIIKDGDNQTQKVKKSFFLLTPRNVNLNLKVNMLRVTANYCYDRLVHT